MATELRLLITSMVLIFLVYMFVLVAQKKVEVRSILTWILLSFGVLFLTLMPDWTERMAHFFGVVLPVNFVFFVGFCLLLVITFSLTRLTSRQNAQIRDLTQKIALLEKDFYHDH